MKEIRLRDQSFVLKNARPETGLILDMYVPTITSDENGELLWFIHSFSEFCNLFLGSKRHPFQSFLYFLYYFRSYVVLPYFYLSSFCLSFFRSPYSKSLCSPLHGDDPDTLKKIIGILFDSDSLEYVHTICTKDSKATLSQFVLCFSLSNLILCILAYFYTSR